MKRRLCFFIALLMMSALCACAADDAANERVEYYVQSRYVRRNTGDVNVTRYSYDENWQPLYTENLLNGNFASAVEYIYSEDKTQLTMNYSSALYESYSTQQELDYDQQGRLIKAVLIENGEVAAVSEYFYDEAGREIKVVSTAPGGQETLLERSYDKDGKLLNYTVDTGFSVSRQDYVYDDEGRMTNGRYYQNGELQNLIEYSYEDNVRYGTVRDKEGNVLSTLKELLDAAGNVLEEERYEPDGELLSYSAYVYLGSDGSSSGSIPG